MLEVIDKGSCTEAHPVPLLFVHGGWHGAWCWDDHFLDFFADAGYRAVALSLRGHGASPTPKPLHRVPSPTTSTTCVRWPTTSAGPPCSLAIPSVATPSSATWKTEPPRPRSWLARCRRTA